MPLNERSQFERDMGVGSKRSGASRRTRSRKSLRTRSLRSAHSPIATLKSGNAASSRVNDMYAFLPSASHMNTPYPSGSPRTNSITLSNLNTNANLNAGNSMEPISNNSPSRINNILTPVMNRSAPRSIRSIPSPTELSAMNGTVTLAGQRYRIEGEVTLTPI